MKCSIGMWFKEKNCNIYLQSASKHTYHEHDHREVVCEHIPPWLQNPERWLLFRELTEFSHWNHTPVKAQ